MVGAVQDVGFGDGWEGKSAERFDRRRSSI